MNLQKLFLKEVVLEIIRNFMDYLQFKAELEMMGISTFENDMLVLKLYKLYLKEDKNDYRKAIGRCLKIPIGD
jgi:hypothetical protein